MPTKKSTTLAKQQQQHFKWYYAIILIGIVAIVGILVLRFSHASSVTTWTAADSEWSLINGGQPTRSTDPNLPTANKTVFPIDVTTKSGGQSDFQLNVPVTVKKGQSLGYCVFLKLDSYDKTPYVQLAFGGGTTFVVTKIIPYSQGEQADAGYKRFCATSQAALYDTNVTAYTWAYIVGANASYSGNLSGKFWKAERYINDPFK